MSVLVTGSAGHLGEALIRTLRARGVEAIGVDVLPSPFTTMVGSVTDRALMRQALAGADAVVHTATLHKPHIASHDRAAFVDTNVRGTLTVLEEAVNAGVRAVVFTSSTSAFGDALVTRAGEPAAWITEEIHPVPRNIYGVTKTAAEDVCEVVHRHEGLPVVILRVARFFPEADDRDEVRASYDDANIKANEYLYRRVDLNDVAAAHLRALDRAAQIGFGRYIISATTPFTRDDAAELGRDAPAVVARAFPDYQEEYQRRGWRMFDRLDRVYDNSRARAELGWQPRYDFRHVLDQLVRDEDPRSPLARTVGAKGYHPTTTGVYTQRPERLEPSS